MVAECRWEAKVSILKQANLSPPRQVSGEGEDALGSQMSAVLLLAAFGRQILSEGGGMGGPKQYYT